MSDLESEMEMFAADAAATTDLRVPEPHREQWLKRVSRLGVTALMVSFILLPFPPPHADCNQCWG